MLKRTIVLLLVGAVLGVSQAPSRAQDDPPVLPEYTLWAGAYHATLKGMYHYAPDAETTTLMMDVEYFTVAERHCFQPHEWLIYPDNDGDGQRPTNNTLLQDRFFPDYGRFEEDGLCVARGERERAIVVFHIPFNTATIRLRFQPDNEHVSVYFDITPTLQLAALDPSLYRVDYDFVDYDRGDLYIFYPTGSIDWPAAVETVLLQEVNTQYIFLEAFTAPTENTLEVAVGLRALLPFQESRFSVILHDHTTPIQYDYDPDADDWTITPLSVGTPTVSPPG